MNNNTNNYEYIIYNDYAKITVYNRKNELNYYEQEIIKIFHTRKKETGYNILPGGVINRKGMKHSSETIKLMSENHMDCSGKNNPFYGMHHTEEAKNSIRKARTGIPRPDNVKEALRKARTGSHQSIKTRKLVSIATKGKNNPRFATKLLSATSKYFGVNKSISHYKDKKYIYWKVQTGINGKNIYIGSYKTELEAAKAYDKYIIKNNVDHPLNFPHLKEKTL